MEELDIREIWQTQKLSTPDLKESELEVMLRKKSQSIVDKLKKFVRIEHIANIIVSILLISYFLYQGDYAFSAALFVFLSFVIIYYKRLYNKLYAIQPTTDVRVYLFDVHRELSDFIKKYMISLTFLFTVAFGFGLYIGLKDEYLGDRLRQPGFYIHIFSTFALSIAACYLVIHLTYGRKARKIKALLDELEE